MPETEVVSAEPFRILSIDGGGLRGILVVQILKWIEQNVLGRDANGNPKLISDSFDLIAGTSTGGMIACALAVSDRQTGRPIFSLDNIDDIYRNFKSVIFPRKKTKLGECRQWIVNKISPKHSPQGLASVLSKKFTSKRILDCSKNIFIPAYNVSRFLPVYFTSRVAKEKSISMQANAAKFNCSLIDVCRATSAAPTYLPSYEFHYTDRLGQDETLNCIDGGVYLNNPAMAAFVEVLSNPFYYRGVPTMNEKDIFILSIGTGKVAKNITAKSGKNWGEVKWAKNVIDAAMLGNSQTIEEQLYSILPGRYLRINLDIDPNFSDMDDSSEETMNYLLNEVFEKDFKSNGSWLTQLTAFKNLANL